MLCNSPFNVVLFANDASNPGIQFSNWAFFCFKYLKLISGMWQADITVYIQRKRQCIHQEHKAKWQQQRRQQWLYIRLLLNLYSVFLQTYFTTWQLFLCVFVLRCCSGCRCWPEYKVIFRSELNGTQRQRLVCVNIDYVSRILMNRTDGWQTITMMIVMRLMLMPSWSFWMNVMPWHPIVVVTQIPSWICVTPTAWCLVATSTFQVTSPTWLQSLLWPL